MLLLVVPNDISSLLPHKFWLETTDLSPYTPPLLLIIWINSKGLSFLSPTKRPGSGVYPYMSYGHNLCYYKLILVGLVPDWSSNKSGNISIFKFQIPTPQIHDFSHKVWGISHPHVSRDPVFFTFSSDPTTPRRLAAQASASECDTIPGRQCPRTGINWKTMGTWYENIWNHRGNMGKYGEIIYIIYIESISSISSMATVGGSPPKKGKSSTYIYADGYELGLTQGIESVTTRI